MKDRGHIVNANKLKITVTAYLVIEFMHYNDTHLNYYKPKGISYLGLNEALFRHIIVKILIEKKYVKKSNSGEKGDVVLTSSLKRRMDKMVGTKNLIEDLFKKFIDIYPNKSGVKTAKASLAIGIPYPDFALKPGRKMREWVDPEVTEKTLRAAGFTSKDIFDVKMKGIPAITKLVKDSPMSVIKAIEANIATKKAASTLIYTGGSASE